MKSLFEKITTWRERIGQAPDFPLHVPTDVERAMVAEIADLRAAASVCNVPPSGWYCTRLAGHDGPCAAHPVTPVSAATPAFGQDVIDGITSILHSREVNGIPQPYAGAIVLLEAFAKIGMTAVRDGKPTPNSLLCTKFADDLLRASEGQAQTSAEVEPETPIECWSSDQEDFNAQSLGELIDCHGGLKAGDTVWMGEAVTPEPSQLIDGDDIITMIGERAYDIAGEHAEDYPDVNKDAEQELNDLLAGWISKHAHPTFWTVHNVKPYVLSHDDFPNDPAPVMCDVPDAAQLAGSTGGVKS